MQNVYNVKYSIKTQDFFVSAGMDSNVYDFDDYHMDRTNAQIFCDEQNDMLKSGQITVHRCKDCGLFFILTEDEIIWYTNKGLNIPKRCKTCIARK